MMGDISTAPLTKNFGPHTDGPILLKSSKGSRRLCDEMKQSRLKPLNTSLTQMVLGTLLGDGSVQWASKNGRYYTTHGLPQESYCRHKAERLKDYISTPPKIIENGGFGDKSCVFSTVTSPAFEFLRTLCYSLQPKADRKGVVAPRLVKTVTPAWLSRLEWEAIAYWFMDDGSLSQAKDSSFNTQGFSQKEVEMLSQTLQQRFGLQNSIRSIKSRRSQSFYWVIYLGVDATRSLVEKIRPWIHESMLYKVNLAEIKMVRCIFCQEEIQVSGRLNLEAPCCSSRDCRLARHRQSDRKYRLNGGREKFNAYQRARYHENLEASRERNRNYAREAMKDPVKHQKILESKQRRRDLNPTVREQDRASARAHWQKLKNDPEAMAQYREARKARARARTPEQKARDSKRIKLWKRRQKMATSNPTASPL